MFEKVLVAVDFSAYSQNILSSIRDIPGIQEVVLLHVVDATHPSRHGWSHEPEIENVKIRLAEKKAGLERYGLKVSVHIDVIVSVITEGDVAHAILEAAEEQKVSLIVLGARGIHPVRELLLGSVSSTVLRNATTHVLIFHAGAGACPPGNEPALQGQLFSRILVPTDFSGPSEDTLSLVAALPGAREIVLLHVVTGAESRRDPWAVSAEEAKDRLDAMGKGPARDGLTVTSRVRIGDPAGMIQSVAAEDAVSLIAMNAFGTGLLREMLLGSTTFTVVRKAEVPVLVVRSKPDPENNGE